MPSAVDIRARLVRQREQRQKELELATALKLRAQQAYQDLVFLGVADQDILDGAKIDSQDLNTIKKQVKQNKVIRPLYQIGPRNGTPPNIRKALPHINGGRFGSDRSSERLVIHFSEGEEDEAEGEDEATSLNETGDASQYSDSHGLSEPGSVVPVPQSEPNPVEDLADPVWPELESEPATMLEPESMAEPKFAPKLDLKPEAETGERNAASVTQPQLKASGGTSVDKSASSVQKNKTSIREEQRRIQEQVDALMKSINQQIEEQSALQATKQQPSTDATPSEDTQEQNVPVSTQPSALSLGPSQPQPLEAPKVSQQNPIHPVSPGPLKRGQPDHEDVDSTPQKRITLELPHKKKPFEYDSPLKIFGNYRFAPLFTRGKIDRVFSATYNGSFLPRKENTFTTSTKPDAKYPDVYGIDDYSFNKDWIVPLTSLGTSKSQVREDVQRVLANVKQSALKSHEIMELVLAARSKYPFTVLE